MTSEKSIDTAQRVDQLVPRVGTVENLLAAVSWQDTAGMQNGWGKGSGWFKYTRLIIPTLVMFSAQGLTCDGATVADDTVILSSSNGFPSGYRPGAAQAFPAYTDDLKVGYHSGPAEAAQLAIQTNGSVQVRGVGLSATVLNCWGIFTTTF